MAENRQRERPGFNQTLVETGVKAGVETGEGTAEGRRSFHHERPGYGEGMSKSGTTVSRTTVSRGVQAVRGVGRACVGCGKTSEGVELVCGRGVRVERRWDGSLVAECGGGKECGGGSGSGEERGGLRELMRQMSETLGKLKAAVGNRGVHLRITTLCAKPEPLPPSPNVDRASPDLLMADLNRLLGPAPSLSAFDVPISN